MRPGTNRLLMLLIGAALAGCANQTERSSSGAGAKAPAEAPVVQAAAAPPPDYEPQREEVKYIDRPLEETPPPKPAPAPRAAANEPLPDFPVTTYELPAEQSDEVEDLGTQADESGTAEAAEEDIAARESSISEPTGEADEAEQAEVEDLGEQADESGTVTHPEDELAQRDSGIGEPSVEPDEPEQAEVEDLGEQADESGTVTHPEDELAQRDSGIGEPTVEPDEPDPVEVADLGTQPDESGTAKYPEDKLAQRDRGISEPKAYTDEPAKRASAMSVSFEAEPLFSFDKAAVRKDQRKSLDDFVAGLQGVNYDEITAVGHADRLGSDAYNQKLSERRANAVKTYLVSQGVPADKIRAEGRGESEPVTGDACKTARGKALISCLQPDRRVDVSVNGSKSN